MNFRWTRGRSVEGSTARLVIWASGVRIPLRPPRQNTFRTGTCFVFPQHRTRAWLKHSVEDPGRQRECRAKLDETAGARRFVRAPAAHLTMTIGILSPCFWARAGGRETNSRRTAAGRSFDLPSSLPHCCQMGKGVRSLTLRVGSADQCSRFQKT